MKPKEKEKTQKLVLIFSLFDFLFIFIIPGFDYRYHLSEVPLWLVYVSTGILLAAYFMVFFVMKQNTYASRVIEIQNDQKVIDNGLYAVVRHPMYLFASIFYCSIPLVLGSFYGLIPAILIPFSLIIRILNEEKVLKENLPGYKEYVKRVKYRLIPFIWSVVIWNMTQKIDRRN